MNVKLSIVSAIAAPADSAKTGAASVYRLPGAHDLPVSGPQRPAVDAKLSAA